MELTVPSVMKSQPVAYASPVDHLMVFVEHYRLGNAKVAKDLLDYLLVFRPQRTFLAIDSIVGCPIEFPLYLMHNIFLLDIRHIVIDMAEAVCNLHYLIGTVARASISEILLQGRVDDSDKRLILTWFLCDDVAQTGFGQGAFFICRCPRQV